MTLTEEGMDIKGDWGGSVHSQKEHIAKSHELQGYKIKWHWRIIMDLLSPNISVKFLVNISQKSFEKVFGWAQIGFKRPYSK